MTEEVTLMGLFHRNRIPSKEFSFAFKDIKDTNVNTNLQLRKHLKDRFKAHC